MAKKTEKQPTKWVKIKANVSSGGKIRHKDQVVELPEDEAAALLDGEHAEEATAPEKK